MVTLGQTISRSKAGLVTKYYEIDALTGAWDNDESGATADQTASIQAQIDAIPDGSVIRFPVGKSEGKYYTQGNLGSNPRGANGILRFNNRKNLIIEGPSPSDPATFYTTEPAVPFGSSVPANTHSLRRHFWFVNCENVTVRNIRVEGSNYTYGSELAVGNPFFWNGGVDSGAHSLARGYRSYWELEHGFEFVSSISCRIHDCEVENVWGDGLSLGGGGTPGGAYGFVGERLTLHGTGRQAVAISRGGNIYLNDLTIGRTDLRPRRAGLDLEPVLTWVIDGVEISNVVMRQGNGVPIAALGSSRVDNIYIHDMQVLSGSGAPWCNVGASDGTRRANWRIENITATGPGSPSSQMRFQKVDGVHVENITCNVSTNQSRLCVRFADSHGSLVIKDTDWGGGCYVDYDTTSSVPVLQGTNTFAGDCVGGPLRNQ